MHVHAYTHVYNNKLTVIMHVHIYTCMQYIYIYVKKYEKFLW